MTHARYLTFDGHQRVSLSAPKPLTFSGEGEVLVQSLYSGISFGTESKVYAGNWPRGLSLDATLPGLDKPVDYPLRYGYATLGKVIRCASPQNHELEGSLVFCFRPHGSHHIVPSSELILLPALKDPRVAVCIPNLETAVSLVMDTAPLAGEAVAVMGLGVVGQLVSSVLSRYPLAELVLVDKDPYRAQLAERRLQGMSRGPLAITSISGGNYAQQLQPEQVDAVIEVSGSLEALAAATGMTRRSGRITVGSLFGDEQKGSPFAPEFHRSQIQLTCSQVSTIAPALAGRFTKSRRMAYVLGLLSAMEAEIAQLITHTVAFEDAESAYEMLATGAGESCQVILKYS